MPYPNLVCPCGDSQTLGTQSTGAINSAGYRSVLDLLAAAAGKTIKFCGALNSGSFTNFFNEGQAAIATGSVRANSAASRTMQQPEGVLWNSGINDLIAATTAVQLGPIFTTALNDLFDRGAHGIPGGGANTLKWVIVSNVLQYPTDLVTINAKVIDFNTNILPGVVAAQRALGRDVVTIDGYSRVAIGADLVHPSDAGYTAWAAAWMEALAPRLRAA